MKPAFSGEAMLKRVGASGEACFILDDVAELLALRAANGNSLLRFAMVLVPIGDDEMPMMQVPNDPQLLWGILDTGQRVLERVSSKRPSNAAALLCKDPAFGWFMYARRHDLPKMVMPRPREDDVANWLRETCDIDSRSRLDAQGGVWRRLMADYSSWLAEEKREVGKVMG